MFLTCPKKSTWLSTASSHPSLLNRSVRGSLFPVWEKDVFVNLLLLQILNALTCEVLEHQGSFRTPSDQIQYIAQTLKDSTCHVYISILFQWRLFLKNEVYPDRFRASYLPANTQHRWTDAARREDPECTGAAGLTAQPAHGVIYRPHKCSPWLVFLKIIYLFIDL